MTPLIRAVTERMRDRFAARRCDPLRLRVHLESPPAWDPARPLRIEGALQYAAILRVCRLMPDELFAGYAGPAVELPIPVADVTMCGRPVACASQAIPCPSSRLGKRLRCRRTRAEAIGRPTVMTNGGEYKALAIPIPTLDAPWLDFFVRGDPDRLADLCRDLHSLGRDGPRGLGVVHRVEIDDDPNDRSLVYQRRPQRPLPVEDEHAAALLYDPTSYDLRPTTTRAPYWRRDSLALCAVPC